MQELTVIVKNIPYTANILLKEKSYYVEWQADILGTRLDSIGWVSRDIECQMNLANEKIAKILFKQLKEQDIFSRGYEYYVKWPIYSKTDAFVYNKQGFYHMGSLGTVNSGRQNCLL